MFLEYFLVLTEVDDSHYPEVGHQFLLHPQREFLRTILLGIFGERAFQSIFVSKQSKHFIDST